MQQFVISDKEEGRRLDQYLQRLLPNAGTSFVYKMLRKKNITVNRKKVDGNIRLSAGDTVEMFFSDETYEKMSGHPYVCDSNNDAPKGIDISEFIKAYEKIGEIPIIYEDDDFIFVDKPVGVLSQKADNQDSSMNEWLIGYLLKKDKIKQTELKTIKPAFCNRLDRNTTGLILGGKSLKGLKLLSGLLKSRELNKFYKATLVGKPDDRLDVTADRFKDYYAYLVKDSKTNTVKISEDTPNTKLKASQIHTSVRLLSVNENNTFDVEIDLHTGKTHQIRAHMAHLGHPIVGDPKYGNGRANKIIGEEFQMLRAWRIVFPILPDFPNISEREFTV